MAPAKSTIHKSRMFLRIKDSALFQFVFEGKPFKLFHQNENSPELVQQNYNHDNAGDYIGFYYCSATYFFVREQAYQFEAAVIVVFMPQIERQTRNLYYLIH
jgi:hypothetical protein